MKLPNFKPRYSFSILITLGVAFVLIGAVIAWQWPGIHKLYFETGASSIGLVINASILGLFFLGIANIIMGLLRYHDEEVQMATFIDNVQQQNKPLAGVKSRSMIARRYFALEALREQMAPIEPGPLASILQAEEAGRLSTARFVQNTLILAGVFGTIVSLSIALLGASDLLRESGAGEGIDKVIYGMSTALSTTVTAIVSYFVLGFFNTKAIDAQTRLILMVETVSNQLLMPRFQSTPASVNERLDQLVAALTRAAESLAKSRDEDKKLEMLLERGHAESAGRMAEILTYMESIQRTLYNGFRLPGDHR